MRTFLVAGLLVVLAAGAVALPGCWNRREIETLAFVLAVGIDRDEAAGLIQVTAQVARPAAVSTGAVPAGGGGAAMQKATWLVTATGRTTFDAVRNLARQSPRRLYWAHNRWILFGEAAAREGVLRYLDFLVRDGETRRRVNVLVTKDDTAANFLQVEFELAKVPAEGGLGLVQNVTAARSSFIRTELNDFLMALEDEGVEPVAGRVETIVKAGPEEKPGELERKVIMKSPAVVGGAAFKGDRLVGWLDETETRGLLWVLNKVKSGVVVVRLPGGQGGVVGLELRGGRAKVSPELRDGKVTMNIEIRTSANIGDLGDSQPPLDPRIDPALIPALEERLAQAVKDEVSRALARAQVDLRSDIFGFGAAIHRSLPKEWHKLKGRWDEEFPRLEVNVKVKATILHPGRSARSVRPG